MKKQLDEQTIDNENIKFSFLIKPSDNNPKESNPKNVPIQPIYMHIPFFFIFDIILLYISQRIK